MIKVSYQVESVAPLLMHNINAMNVKKPAGINSEDWENSAECFEAKMYLNASGNVELPTRVLQGLLKTAAKRAFTMGIKPKKGSYTQLVQSLVFFESGLLLDQSKNDVLRECQFVTIGPNKVLRIWPKLLNWSGTFSALIADEKALPVKTLDSLLEISGKLIGMGDYRPQFGRFKIKNLK